MLGAVPHAVVDLGPSRSGHGSARGCGRVEVRGTGCTEGVQSEPEDRSGTDLNERLDRGSHAKPVLNEVKDQVWSLDL